jgi:phosphatidylglycerophosphate synthase
MAKNKKTLKKIEKHRRVNDILLGPLERPAIAWLVEHMPHWVTPDHLTILGFGASILTGVSYALTDIDKNYLWLANLGFILNWVGDSLDGNLARYRKIERPKYGFFIDHTIDAASEVIIFIGIGLSPYVDLTLALLALVGYLCMANLVYITTSVEGVFKISYGRLGPTEIRALAILANITVYFLGNPQISLPWIDLSLYNLIVSVIVALLVIFFVNTTVKQAIRFEREDRAKWLEKVNAFEKREPTEKSN